MLQNLFLYFYKSNQSNMNYQSHIVKPIKRADSDIQKYAKQLKKIKYPVFAIQPAQQLLTKISHFKNEKLTNQMKKKLIEEKQLNAYRKIRGDGNCFFRALAFSFLSNSKFLSSLNQTFTLINDIDLTCCYEKSIPKQFKSFYNDKILKQTLMNNWSDDVLHFSLQCKSNNKRLLSRLLRKFPYLDFIIILYFRAVCFNILKKNKQSPQLKQFMKGTQQEQIRTYGQQSEGVILNLLSRSLKIGIDVYQVRKEQIKHYSYKPIKSDLQVCLLYYESHYDLIEKISNDKYQQQKQDANNLTQEDYYSEVQSNMIQGQCIQCGKKGNVYEQNLICGECFEKSRVQLLNTCKGKIINGTCESCGRKNVKVLEMMQICQSCLEKQKQLQSSPKTNKVKYYCNNCGYELNQNKQCNNCVRQKFQMGICLSCRYRQKIDSLTKICRNCKQIQSNYLKKHEEKIDRSKEQQQKCQNCGQSFGSQFHQMKCVNKFTQGKIDLMKIPKIQKPNKPIDSQKLQTQYQQKYQDKTCLKCKRFKVSQSLKDGMCQQCLKQYERQRQIQQAHKSKMNGSKLDFGSSSSKLGSHIQEVSQKCKFCKRPAYTYKMQNGVCKECKKQIGLKF